MRGYIIYDFYFLFGHNICNWSGEVEDVCPKTIKIMMQLLKSLKQSLCFHCFFSSYPLTPTDASD